jgi:hypothetical protein
MAAKDLTIDSPKSELLDPRARAAQRAAELMGLYGNDIGDDTDDYYIDPAIIPDGWTYEWKRFTVLGAQDPAYQVTLARGGWEAVPAQRHPEMMPVGWAGATIERKGQLLMERPKQITDLVKQREYNKARQQVGQKEAQLYGQPAGPNSPFDPTYHGKSLTKIGKSYDMPIPDK